MANKFYASSITSYEKYCTSMQISNKPFHCLALAAIRDCNKNINIQSCHMSVIIVRGIQIKLSLLYGSELWICNGMNDRY